MSYNGVMNKFGKFLDHNSSKKDIVKPSCPLNKTSHKTTAERIMFKALQIPKLSLDIKKLVKYPQKRI